jgi:hypothetical protein
MRAEAYVRPDAIRGEETQSQLAFEHLDSVR